MYGSLKPVVRHVVDYHLRQCIDYVDRIERCFKREQIDMEKWAEKETDGMSDAERNDFGERYYEDWIDVSETFPRLFFHSTLVSI
jgi:hypothetical protein